jgi:hypothetical protein
MIILSTNLHSYFESKIIRLDSNDDNLITLKEQIKEFFRDKTKLDTSLFNTNFDLSSKGTLLFLKDLFDINHPTLVNDLYFIGSRFNGKYWEFKLVPENRVIFAKPWAKQEMVHLFRKINTLGLEHDWDQLENHYLKKLYTNAIFIYTENKELYQYVAKRSIVYENKLLYTEYSNRKTTRYGTIVCELNGDKQFVPYDPIKFDKYANKEFFLKDKEGIFHPLGIYTKPTLVGDHFPGISLGHPYKIELVKVSIPPVSYLETQVEKKRAEFAVKSFKQFEPLFLNSNTHVITLNRYAEYKTNKK